MSESPERSPEIFNGQSEKNESLVHNIEIIDRQELDSNNTEKQKDEASAEDLREEAVELAEREEKNTRLERESETEPKRVVRGPISKKHKQENYKRILSNIQSELPRSSRKVSKVIHNPIIEKTSDILASTIMRPRPLLIASIFGFILPLVTYLIAKEMGYQLSGSESILAMLIGFIFGLIVDYFRLLIGKK